MRAFASTWSDRQVVLLGLGGSVTQGLGASPGRMYFRRLVKNPPDEFANMQGICLSRVLPHLEPLNLALSGTMSDYQLSKLKPCDAESWCAGSPAFPGTGNR